MYKDLKKEQGGKQKNEELLWRLGGRGVFATAWKTVGQQGRIKSPWQVTEIKGKWAQNSAAGPDWVFPGTYMCKEVRELCPGISPRHLRDYEWEELWEWVTTSKANLWTLRAPAGLWSSHLPAPLHLTGALWQYYPCCSFPTAPGDENDNWC